MSNTSRHGGSWIAMIALTSILAGCSSDSDRQTSSSGTSVYRDSEKSTSHEAATVEMQTHLFSPREVTIRAGESVTWKNASNEVHTVTADPLKGSNPDSVVLPPGAKAFHSGEIRPGKSWRQTFTATGTYRYVCTLHERDGMTGTVVVRPSEPQTR